MKLFGKKNPKDPKTKSHISGGSINAILGPRLFRVFHITIYIDLRG